MKRPWVNTRVKLGSGFVFITALLLFALGATYQSVDAIKKARLAAMQEDAAVMDYWKLSANLAHQRYQMFDLLLSRSKSDRVMLEQRIHARAQRIDVIFARTLASSRSDPQINRSIQELNRLRNTYRSTREKQILPLFHRGERGKAISIHAGLQRVRFETISALSQSLAQQAQKQARQQALETAQVEQQSIRRIVLSSIATLFLGIVLLALWIHSLVGQMVRHLIGGMAHETAASDFPGADQGEPGHMAF